jgi:hypothetical protein
MQVIDPLHLCPECLIIKTPRSRHCSVCNKCVERYDHHCPWINNCVGINNHRSFIIFLLSLIVAIISVFVGSIIELTQIKESEVLTAEDLNYSFLPDSIITNRLIYLILTYVILFITGFFIFPIMLLIYI